MPYTDPIPAQYYSIDWVEALPTTLPVTEDWSA